MWLMAARLGNVLYWAFSALAVLVVVFFAYVVIDDFARGVAVRAREIAARTNSRFVVDTTREEMRQVRFAKAKRLIDALRAKSPKR
jgi:hypothetical protein